MVCHPLVIFSFFLKLFDAFLFGFLFPPTYLYFLPKCPSQGHFIRSSPTPSPPPAFPAHPMNTHTQTHTHSPYSPLGGKDSRFIIHFHPDTSFPPDHPWNSFISVLIGSKFLDSIVFNHFS